MLALGVLGAAITYLAYSIDGRREKLAAELHDIETKRQIEILAKAPWKNGRLLEVKAGRAGVLIASLALAACILFASSLVSETETRWGMLVGSILFSAFVLFAFVRALACIGKPALVLNIRGFQTPLYGMIPWCEVSGINLQKLTLRASTAITLNFKVDSFAKAVASFHWTERLLNCFGLKRKIVVVTLNGTSEDPDVVAAVARLLWQQSTGMSHEWSPMLSKKFNQAARSAHEFMERHKDPNACAQDILNDPDKALKEVKLFGQDIETVISEKRRTVSYLNSLMVIGVLGIVVALFWPLVRSHLLS